MRLTSRMSKFFAGLSLFNAVVCLYLYTLNTSAQPSMLNYRFGTFVAAVWFMTLSILARSITYAALSAVFGVIIVLSFFDVSSYLFLATTNAVLVYLMLINDDHAKS